MAPASDLIDSVVESDDMQYTGIGGASHSAEEASGEHKPTSAIIQGLTVPFCALIAGTPRFPQASMQPRPSTVHSYLARFPPPVSNLLRPTSVLDTATLFDTQPSNPATEGKQDTKGKGRMDGENNGFCGPFAVPLSSTLQGGPLPASAASSTVPPSASAPPRAAPTATYNSTSKSGASATVEHTRTQGVPSHASSSTALPSTDASRRTASAATQNSTSTSGPSVTMRHDAAPATNLPDAAAPADSNPDHSAGGEDLPLPTCPIVY